MNVMTPVSLVNTEGCRRFDLRKHDEVEIDGIRHMVEFRRDDLVHFAKLDDDGNPTNDLRALTDLQIAHKSARGDFSIVRFVVDAKGRARRDIPDIRVLDDDEAAEMDRRWVYVMACLQWASDDDGKLRRTHGGGFGSRRKLDPVIDKTHERVGGERPAFETVRRWIKTWLLHGQAYGKFALAPKHHRKGRKTEFRDLDEDIDVGIANWLRVGGVVRNGYAVFVNDLEKKWLAEGRLAKGERIDPKTIPSERTFYRRCADIDFYTRDVCRLGAHNAKQIHKIRRRLELPERPYEVVECDHTYVDILLVHPTARIVLGRPVLTSFVCRATKMIVGYSIGYEVPSYAAFFEGLRNTIYPKDLSAFPNVKKPWNAYGMIENLVVDNGKEFVGSNIENAAHLLGMNVVHMRPREPNMKGFVERLFGILNVQLVHSAPGTTLSNPQLRKKHEAIDPPVLTLNDFEALLVQWIVMRNHMPTRGLDARMYDAASEDATNVPAKEWNRLATIYPCGELLKPNYFDIVAGDKVLRVISAAGISWDNIQYYAEELASLRSRSDGTTRAGINKNKFLCSRDPYDLSKIHVQDPKTKKWLVVRASDAYGDYTRGLSLHVHRQVNARAIERKKAAIDAVALMKARAELTAEADALLALPKHKTVQRRLARFVESNVKASRRIDIYLSPESESDEMMSIAEEMDLLETSADETHLDAGLMGASEASTQCADDQPQPVVAPGRGNKRAKKTKARHPPDERSPAPAQTNDDIDYGDDVDLTDLSKDW